MRLVRRKRGKKNYFYAQLINAGIPFQKPKHQVGKETVGLDLGPSTIAIVGQEKATLKPFCSEIANKSREIRRLQRKLERQRRANNPNNYEPDFKEAKGRKKKGKIRKEKKTWHNSRSYLKTRQQKAEIERKLAAHRTSLQNCLAHEVFSYGHISSIGKASPSQRYLRNEVASERIIPEALERQVKNQDVVAKGGISPQSESLVEI